MERGPDGASHRAGDLVSSDWRKSGKAWRLWAAIPLILLGILLAATNNHFNILDDEVVMLNPATVPAAETVRTLMAGDWHEEHPPFPDLLLHFWWSVAPGSLFWLRLPFLCCYLLAFSLFVATAHRLAGPRAALALAWLTLCSPFALHFGRLLGWYSIGALLVALVTYCYTRWLESGSTTWAACLWMAGLGLLYTSYFAWVLLGLIALDAALFRPTSRVRAYLQSAVGMLLYVVAFAPLWRSFLEELHHPAAKVEGSRLAAYLFDMYALLVSESFAPWFFKVGIPAALLCGLCYLLALLGSRGLSRRLLVYFLLSTGLLAAIGSITTKRLIFLMGWFFLALAFALTQREMPRLRAALTAAVFATFAVGWYGAISGRYYATTHFVDDWKDGITAALEARTPGTVIVYDNPVAAFYLSRALSSQAAHYVSYDNCTSCAAESAETWSAQGHRGTRVIALRGTQYGMLQNSGDVYLERHCQLENEQHFTQNPAAAIKRRFFPTQHQPEWRVRVETYRCPSQ